MKRITEKLYGILTKRGNVNFYVVANGDDLTVIDTGISAADSDRLEAGLKTQGWSLDNVQRVLITHAHADHIGGLPELQKRANVQTYAHKYTASIIRGEQEMDFADPAELGGLSRLMRRFLRSPSEKAQVEHELEGGEILDEVLPGFQAIHTPGHTHGHLVYWWPEQRVLIGGDVMMRLPWGLRMPLRAPSVNWQQAKQSIHQLADMNVAILCLTHGNPLVDDVDAKIKKLSARIKS
jgi:glyoxylase-like metal-dependent hydrolase (beta-lactamase superfamily II)